MVLTPVERIVELRRVRAEMYAGYFQPDRRVVLARLDEQIAGEVQALSESESSALPTD